MHFTQAYCETRNFCVHHFWLILQRINLKFAKTMHARIEKDSIVTVQLTNLQNCNAAKFLGIETKMPQKLSVLRVKQL